MGVLLLDVTGVKQSQLLVLRLSLEFDKISTKLINTLQNDNEELKKALGVEKDKCEEKARVFENSKKDYQDCFRTFEKKVVDQEVIIEALEHKSRNFENKVKDLQDEIDANKKQIEILENKSKNSSKLTSSNNSLKNELASLHLISCESCGLTFQNKKKLNVHKQEKHKMQILQKVEELQRQILCQRSSLTSSLLKLKEKEFKSRQSCSCKGFCKITHLKHNYFKSKADELCDRMNKISKENKEHFRI